MSNLKETLKNKKSLIPFITCGDPDLTLTEKFALTLEEAGADAVILGIPFSDPTAEGPVVYEANLRALSIGVTTDKIIEMAKGLSKKIKVPLIFMTYANVVYTYGIERFAKESSKAGISGLVLFDIPYEEREEFAPICESFGIDFIPFVSPSKKTRIAEISKSATGLMFIMGSGEKEVISGILDIIRENSDVPCVAGFDDLTPNGAKEVIDCSDGIALCTDIVKIIEKYGKKAQKHIFKYVKSMKDAI